MTTCGCGDDEEKDTPARRMQRVYNRGRFDGLRLVGIDPEEFMRARKMAEAEASLNATGHKVLEAIPVTESWPLHRIHGALVTKGCQLGLPAVEGSVHHAMELGLVRETHPGMFVRVEWKEPRVVQLTPRPDPPAAPQPPPSAPSTPIEMSDPLAALAALSARLRAVARDLTQMADSVDEQALAFEEKLQRVETDGAKLKQLRTLLASLSG